MSATVLIAEDDPNILISLSFLLSNAGYSIVTASDGTKAWTLYEAQRPALAVLDVMLPGIDGFELCRRIRAAPAPAATRQAKVLILSARGLESEITKGLQLGADAWLRKPFGTRELLDTVSRLLSS